MRLTFAAAIVVLVGACGTSDSAAPVTSTTATSRTRIEHPSSTASTTPTTSVFDVPHYAGVGDSLMWAASTKLEQLLAPDPIDVHAVPGVTADDAMYELARVDLEDTDALVLSVGTNDAIHGATAEELAKIDAVAERVSAVPCVRWMAVAASSSGETYDEAARRVNDELRSLATRYPNLRVNRWDEQMAQHSEWLSDDGIHHTKAGIDAYAAAMALELRSCPARVQR